MSENQTEMFDIDSLVEGTLDELADMPVFQPFPNGAHKVKIEMFEIDKAKGQVKIPLTYIEVVELATPTDKAPVAGDKQTIFIQLMKKDKTPNEFGQGQLKVFLSGLAEGGYKGKNGEIMEQAKGAEVIILTKIQKSKDPQYPDKMQVEGLSIA